MTYIDRLNAFNRWLEHNYLPHVSQLMYFRLLDLFNRCGWAEWVSVDNLRLMSMVHVESKNTLLRARDKLVQAGWLEFRKGKKGLPNQYRLGNGANNEPQTELEAAPEEGCGAINERQMAPQTEPQMRKGSKSERQMALQTELKTALQTGPIIRPKTKTKDIPPPPLRACACESDSGLGVVMREYLEKINPTPSQSSMEELQGFFEEMGAECCLRAFDIALDAKKANWHYVRGILRSKFSRGVRCLADWDALEEEREKTGRAGAKSPQSGYYGGETDPERVKTEMDWMDQFLEVESNG